MKPKKWWIYHEKKKAIECKCVFIIKYKVDGIVEHYKTHLVVKGFTQTYSTNYTETFTPVAKLNTIWVLMSLTSNLDWSLQQLDIKNVFLNDVLNEEIYMILPPSLCENSKKNVACKLNKSLHGLKQSPKT